MRHGKYVRCLALGLLQTLVWSSFVCAQSNQDDGCPAHSLVDPQSAVIVIDSIEFQEGTGLTPDIRTRLVDELKHRSFHASSPADTDWQSELRDEIRVPLEEQGYFKIVVDVTSGLVRAEPHRLHYWVSVRTESGPQFHLGEVRFENATEFSENVLIAQLPMQRGDLFSAPKVREALDNIRRLYLKRGYIAFTSELITDIDSNAHRIDLTVKVDPSVQYRVGAVEIRGLNAPAEKLLRSKLETGQGFDGTVLNEFFTANGALLPSGMSLQNGVTIARDVQGRMVNVVFEHRVCPTP
jgi:hypothetical protein